MLSEREALLRAVCANPDDDLVRLVFADWLDEHDEPERAEFIRLQIAVAKKQIGAGVKQMSNRASLIQQRHNGWINELPKLPGLVWDTRLGVDRPVAARDGWQTELIGNGDFEFTPRYTPQPIQIEVRGCWRGFYEEVAIHSDMEPYGDLTPLFDTIPIRSFTVHSEYPSAPYLLPLCRSAVVIIEIGDRILSDANVLMICDPVHLLQLKQLTIRGYKSLDNAKRELLQERFGGRLRAMDTTTCNRSESSIRA